MPTHLTPLTCQVETAKICNQFVEFRLQRVSGGLEFSQSASGGLDRNINLYPPNLIHAHPYYVQTTLITIVVCDNLIHNKLNYHYHTTPGQTETTSPHILEPQTASTQPGQSSSHTDWFIIWLKVCMSVLQDLQMSFTPQTTRFKCVLLLLRHSQMRFNASQRRAFSYLCQKGGEHHKKESVHSERGSFMSSKGQEKADTHHFFGHILLDSLTSVWLVQFTALFTFYLVDIFIDVL